MSCLQVYEKMCSDDETVLAYSSLSKSQKGITYKCFNANFRSIDQLLEQLKSFNKELDKINSTGSERKKARLAAKQRIVILLEGGLIEKDSDFNYSLTNKGNILSSIINEENDNIVLKKLLTISLLIDGSFNSINCQLISATQNILDAASSYQSSKELNEQIKEYIDTVIKKGKVSTLKSIVKHKLFWLFCFNDKKELLSSIFSSTNAKDFKELTNNCMSGQLMKGRQKSSSISTLREELFIFSFLARFVSCLSTDDFCKDYDEFFNLLLLAYKEDENYDTELEEHFLSYLNTYHDVFDEVFRNVKKLYHVDNQFDPMINKKIGGRIHYDRTLESRGNSKFSGIFDEDTERKNKKLGAKGEKYIYDLLQKEGKNPDWISGFACEYKIKKKKEVNDGAGYDMTYTENGTTHYVEVKTTSRKNGLSFFISNNEILTAKKLANYHLFLVTESENGKKFTHHDYKNVFEDLEVKYSVDSKCVRIDPVKWKAAFDKTKAQ